MGILDNLNDAQRAAVEAGSGPILVLAGPGSGKTRVLTHRIVYLILEGGIAPWRIMAVTFTNKAAREMRQRVDFLLGTKSSGLTMGTFHATCARILRMESDNLLGYDRNFLIFDTADQRQVTKQALQDLDIDDKRFPPNKVLSGISMAKNELVTPEQYAASNYVSEITRRVYQRYQDILIANNAMDFDDLLMNTVLLLDERPDLLEKYQRKYQHILVDEFQDTNTAQYELLKRLVNSEGNIFVVGDADQSIYKWRGADFRNLIRFREHYPNARLILLEQNYRSTQVILDAAKAVIRHNQERIDKELFTKRKGGAQITIREAYNDLEEAQMVAETIQELEEEGFHRKDCAVMYRTNAQSRVFEDVFIRAGIEHRLVGATRFYGRREIKDLIAYLRLIHSPADSVSFGRIVNTPTRGIGKKTLQTLNQWAQREGYQPGEALLLLVEDPDIEHPFNGRAYSALSRFGIMLQDWMKLKEQLTISELLDTIIDGSAYRQYIDDGTIEGQDRWANVMELRNVTTEYDESSLGEFLEQVALVSDVDDLEEEPNATTLLTLHAAKGLEFPVVFIVGLEEGMLPHSRSLEEADELAEERRLFYVGLTRAMDRIFLSHAFRRTTYGGTEVSVPSRFILDIPDDLLDGGSTSHRRRESKRRVTSWAWSAETSDRGPTYKDSFRTQRSTIPKELPDHYHRQDQSQHEEKPVLAKAQFRTGQQVQHHKFGDGIVIESKLTGNDEEVVVAFSEAGVGIKKLVASLAKLEIKE